MPTFDISSEYNQQEVVNAVDQAHREISNRYDFRDTGTFISYSESTITLKSSTCLLYTSPSPRDVEESRMPSSA